MTKICYIVGENICKPHIEQRTIILNSQNVNNSQNSTEKKGKNWKIAKSHEQTFHTIRYR